VFTAGRESYATLVLDALDPTRSIFRHRLFRQHCVFKTFNHGVLVKDLRILNRPMHRTVLIDNSVSSFLHQLRNGIPIVPFFDNPNDCALATLQQLLHVVHAEPDVRVLLDKVFSLERILGRVATATATARRIPRARADADADADAADALRVDHAVSHAMATGLPVGRVA